MYSSKNKVESPSMKKIQLNRSSTPDLDEVKVSSKKIMTTTKKRVNDLKKLSFEVTDM